MVIVWCVLFETGEHKQSLSMHKNERQSHSLSKGGLVQPLEPPLPTLLIHRVCVCTHEIGIIKSACGDNKQKRSSVLDPYIYNSSAMTWIVKHTFLISAHYFISAYFLRSLLLSVKRMHALK